MLMPESALPLGQGYGLLPPLSCCSMESGKPTGITHMDSAEWVPVSAGVGQSRQRACWPHRWQDAAVKLSRTQLVARDWVFLIPK